MLIVWDEPKRQANIAKHGFDFADLTLEFFESAVLRPAREPRRFAFGPFGEGYLAVVYVQLGREALSIISMRPASWNERSAYEQAKRV